MTCQDKEETYKRQKNLKQGKISKSIDKKSKKKKINKKKEVVNKNILFLITLHTYVEFVDC